jgi:hypothetical protein
MSPEPMQACNHVNILNLIPDERPNPFENRSEIKGLCTLWDASDNESYAIECRFSSTTNCTARNNLADAPIHLRDSATATLSSNLITAVPGMFANPIVGDLHLLSSATIAIDKAPTLSTMTNDFDGERRPRGARSDIGADEFSTNAPPQFTGLRVIGPDCSVSLLTLLGESYDVLRADDPAGSPWSLVTNNLPGSGGVISITDANGASRLTRFYRARLSL